jgi:hypothetical protein
MVMVDTAMIRLSVAALPNNRIRFAFFEALPRHAGVPLSNSKAHQARELAIGLAKAAADAHAANVLPVIRHPEGRPLKPLGRSAGRRGGILADRARRVSTLGHRLATRKISLSDDTGA